MKWDGDTLELGEQSSAEQVWIVFDTDDVIEAEATLAAAVAPFLGPLYLNTARIDKRIAERAWLATVRYGETPKPAAGEQVIEFDTGGGTTKITQSIATVARYAPQSSACNKPIHWVSVPIKPPSTSTTPDPATTTTTTVAPAGYRWAQNLIFNNYCGPGCSVVRPTPDPPGSADLTQVTNTIGGQIPNFGGAIGVKKDSVEGVDIVAPALHFSRKCYFEDAFVTAAYIKGLARLTGRVNNAAFLGFDAGEVLLLGAQGSKRGNELWEITFKFAGSENADGLAVGSITGISKRGHDYLWVLYQDTTDQNSKTTVKQPAFVYVEQVYQYDDLSQLGIGS